MPSSQHVTGEATAEAADKDPVAVFCAFLCASLLTSQDEICSR